MTRLMETDLSWRSAPPQQRTSHAKSTLRCLVYALFASSLLISTQTPTALGAPLNVQSLKEGLATLPSLRATVDQGLTELIGSSAHVKVRARADRVGPALLLKLNIALRGDDDRARALYFIERASKLWSGLDVYIQEVKTRAGRSVVELRARINGLPLLNQQSRLSIKDGVAQHLSNGMGAIGALVNARIDEEHARASALKAARLKTHTPSLSVGSSRHGVVSHSPGVAFEVFEVRLVDVARARTWVALIDGRDGAMIQLRSGEVQ